MAALWRSVISRCRGKRGENTLIIRERSRGKTAEERAPAAADRLLSDRRCGPPRYRECNYLRLSYVEPLELNWISFSSRASWERRRDASHFDLFFADLLPSLYAAPTRSTFRDLDRRFVGGDRASSTSSGKRIEMRIDSLNGQFERFPNAQIKGRIKFEVVTCSGVINYHVVFDNLKIYFTKGIMFSNASIKVSFERARFIART